MTVIYGDTEKIASWMRLVRKVRDNFPGLDTEEDIIDHEKTVLRFMHEHRAVCVMDKDETVGVLLFSKKHNSICFLAVAPEHRRQGIASALLKRAIAELDARCDITVSTFRAEDEKGTAPRALYKKFGFAEDALTVEFGYPNQVFVLHPRNGTI